MPPLSPQITLAGNLHDISGVLDAGSSLRVGLAGYGGQPPRVAGTAMLIKTYPAPILCPAGAYNFKLWGNDVIAPGGTFYNVELIDDRGNPIQIGAYQFTGTQSIDLSSAALYQPPVPPTLPLVSGLEVTVAFSATPVFPASSAGLTGFEITLTGNVTSSTMTGIVPGALYTFAVLQDGVGGHTFAWPAICNGAQPVGLAPGNLTVQTFYARAADNQLYSIAPAAIY